MSWAATILTLLSPLGSAFTPWTELVEQIPVEVAAGTPALTRDPLLATLTVTGLKKAIPSGASRSCPDVEATSDGWLLRCHRRRLHAQLIHDARGWLIDIRQLRGLPFGPTRDIAWSPLRVDGVSPDAICASTVPAAIAECALGKGLFAEAKAKLEAALSDPSNRSLAELRLGDLAMQEGDPTEALAHWERVSHRTNLGRVADSRICELTGKCLGLREAGHAYETVGLDPLATRDLRLRRARLEAYADRDEGVLEALAQSEEACRGAPGICQRLLLSTLREGEANVEALERYLDAPYRDVPEHRLALARAAAKISRERGAPGVSATILSTVTPSVGANELPEHLLTIIETYWDAGDRIRAATILEFAQTRLKPSLRRGSRWQRLEHVLRRVGEGESRRDWANDQEKAAAPVLGRAAEVLAKLRDEPKSMGAAP